VLEVGPGLGVLTDALSRAAGRVFAVEVDPAMLAVLEDLFGGRANVSIVAADILRADPAAILGLPADARGRRVGYKVVANLPYNITSAVLRHLLEARVVPERAVVMVQKEVADRILATPGDMSILAVAVQFYAQPSRVSIVPAGAFYPAPKVDSAVLRLDVYAAPPVDVDDVGAFFRVVRAGFSQKRKQIKNSLAAGLQLPADAVVAALTAAGIEPSRRAETLGLAEWAALLRAIAIAAPLDRGS
jgi:16S rRNA (adenine1518-N6/adenine1519-N6)-dimethyltransferase